MLFVLVINMLNMLLSKATKLGILRCLGCRELATSVSFYADDVVIFCHPDEPELRAVCGTLGIFGHASGMHTNIAKCLVSPIPCLEEVAIEAADVMECQLESST
jgi:hypothetical protein